MPCTARQLRTLCRQAGDIRRLWIAYSGGIDSHVLLHRTHALRPHLPEIAGAIHIHHGLSPQADDWQNHCRRICAQAGIHCITRKVTLHEGEGPEDQARIARYQALAAIIQPGDALLTAQHQDDQAETLLLQAIRGGGPRGIAAMPPVAPLGHGHLLRPLLTTSRQQIHDYARRHRLQWQEDHTNQDTRYDRNYLRNEIMPLLRQRWPAAARTLARTAAHTAALLDQADALLERELQNNRGKQPGTLSITALGRQPAALAGLLIRAQCRKQQMTPPATAHIKELLEKQLHAAPHRRPHINWPGGEFRRYRDDLYINHPLPAADTTDWQHDWNGDGPCRIPQLGGILKLTETVGRGLRPELVHQGIQVRPRRGGETCKIQGDNHTRTLKTIYQRHGIPPWERHTIPLLYIQNKLAAIGELAVSRQAGVQPTQTGLSVSWQKTA